MIKVRLDTYSRNRLGSIIATWVLTYPRYAHADLMTHRVMSKNGASSRAIPMSQMISAVIKEPAIPIIWGKNGKGMQAHGELGPVRRWIARRLWLAARWPVLVFVWLLMKVGLHKQWTNRLLEPWLHMTIVLTATDHDNFLDLRDGPYAQPELAEVARLMRKALYETKPTQIDDGCWHIPLLTDDERKELAKFYAWMKSVPIEQLTTDTTGLYGTILVKRLIKAGVARAARVSYIRHEMVKTHTEDCELHDRLRDQKHWSAFEHCAQADPDAGWVGNFYGWVQYRKKFAGESGSKIVRDTCD